MISRIMALKYKTTADIPISKKLVDQVIGQPEAIEIIKKAAQQRRHVLLIGEPGVGKSLAGQALAELLPKENLTDIVVFPNQEDENVPIIKEYPKGKGKQIVAKSRFLQSKGMKFQNWIFYVLIFISILSPWWVRKQYGDILAAATLISSMIFIAIFVIYMSMAKRMKGNAQGLPKILEDNSANDKSPFLDGTGAHAGALLGDCLHDPLQSIFAAQDLLIMEPLKNQQYLMQQGTLNIIDNLLEKHQKKIIKNKSYEAAFLDKKELIILGEKENKIEPVEVLSVNRYEKEGEIIKLTTESGKEIIITPEHKVAVNSLAGIRYIEARKLKSWHKLLAINE